MSPLHKTEKRRQEIVEAAAAHLIEHGFQSSGLRAIAKSAGVSDRMIMYYFDTKDDLVSAALEMIGEGLAEGMESAVPEGNATPNQILEALSNNAVRRSTSHHAAVVRDNRACDARSGAI